MSQTKFNCKDVEKSVANHKDKQVGFIFLYHLTKWMLECLKKKERDNDEFSNKEEKIMLNEIVREVRKVSPDLIILDVENLKFIGLSLNDYLIEGDVEFNKFLISSILESYNSIAYTIFKKFNTTHRRIKMEKYRVLWMHNVKVLQEENLIQRFSSTEPQFEKTSDVAEYLKHRRDVSSLYKISSQIERFKRDIEESKLSPKEEGLALQRVFHIIGEYIKYTEMTPNLSNDIRESLVTENIPIKILAHFRDILAHHQIFRLLDIGRIKIRNVLERGLIPINDIVKKEIIDLEDTYIRNIIRRNNLNSFLDSQGMNIDESLVAKRFVRLFKHLKTIPANVRKVYESAIRMRSKSFSDGLWHGGTLSNPKNYLINFVIECKLRMYNELFNKFKSWRDFGKLGFKEDWLKWNHQFALEMIAAMDQLNYGGTSQDFFEEFLKLNTLKEIFIDEKVKEYIDPKEIASEQIFAWPKGVPLTDVISMVEKSVDSVGRRKLIAFLKELDSTGRYEVNHLSLNEYKSLVNDLKLDKASADTLHSFSVEWKKMECFKLLKKQRAPLKEFYEHIAEGNLIKIEKKFKMAVPFVEELYEQRFEEELWCLEDLGNPDAVKSEIINVYSLLDNAAREISEGPKKGEGKGHEETPDIAQAAEEKRDMSKFRNYLSHGDTITSEWQQAIVDIEMVEAKNQALPKLLELMLENKKINMQEIENAIDGLGSKIRKMICPVNTRRRIAREIEGCLEWDDIENVIEGDLEDIDPDTMKIDSEKLITVLSIDLEMNVEKFHNFIELASETEVEGSLKNEVIGLVEHHKAYTKHFEKVGKFSGVAMHGLMAKDIVGHMLKGDLLGVAIDLTFLGGGVALGKFAEFVSMRGAGYLIGGNALLGKSLKVASPFLSKGLSVLIAYDLWQQIKAMKAGNKDAIVSVVGDVIILSTDTAELTIEVAEGLSLIEGVSAVTGPIGMAIGLGVFVGVEIYKAVRAVQKIDKKIHLTGWERFVQGEKAFFGLEPSEYLNALMEEIDGNNAAVQMAIKLLKENSQLQRYIFPSFKHVNGKLETALDSVVRLDKKVRNILWTRSRPDDVSGVNIFCKPKGNWEAIPSDGSYYCENAIGVEYPTERSDNYTLINLGEGNDWVEGFPDSGNIFLIDRSNKTLFGGRKDDSFIFKRKSYEISNFVGFLDGQEGLDTINVGGLILEDEFKFSAARVVADFPSGSLAFSYADHAQFRMKRINKYVGIPNITDRVVFSACDTKFVDGKEGYDEYCPDIYEIGNEDRCVYNTTMVVGSFTEVKNNADTGDFRYFIHGKAGKKSQIFIKPSSKTNNTFTFNYALRDIASIARSPNNGIQFSFVSDYYKLYMDSAFDNSFNITIEGSNEKDDFFLIDNTKIILGEKNMYALQKSENPIDDIVEEYSDIMANLDLYGVVHSRDEVLTITGRQNDIVRNDPTSRTSHFVGGAGDNIVAFTSGQEIITMDTLPFNETVIHYFNKNNGLHLDMLDLREIKKQVMNDLEMGVEVEIREVVDDLIVSLYIPFDNKANLMKITLKDVVKHFRYRKIRIVMEAVFIIEEIQGDYRLTPIPLVFNDKSYSVFVINPRDVVDGMTIKIAKECRFSGFFRNDDSLIITNSFKSDADAIGDPISTVILNNLYNPKYENKMRSLTVEFADVKFKLSEETRRIDEAEDFDESRRETAVKIYKGISTAMKTNLPLVDAINSNDLEKVKSIIDNGDVTTIVSSREKWMNPLAYATAKGLLRIVEYMVSKGADCTAKDSSGHIPAYYAVRNDFYEIADFLLSKLFGQGDEGMLAIVSELKIVKYLNEVKDPNFTMAFMEHQTSTLLHYAAMNGNLEVVIYIMEKCQDGLKGNLRTKNSFQQPPFYYAMKNGHGEIMTYMAEMMKKERMTPLGFAAETGSLEIVKYLIEERRADVYEKDGFGVTPLHYAFEKEYKDIFEYLVQIINMEGEGQHLVYAIITNDVRLMEYIINEGKTYDFSLNINGKSPLHYSVIHGNLDMMKLLFVFTDYMYAKDRKGNSPLYYAQTKRNPEIREYLRCRELKTIFPEGSLPHDAMTDDGFISYVKENRIPSSIYNSREQHVMQLTKYLIEKRNVSPNVKNNRNQSPLHFAAAHGDMVLVKYLIKQGADLFIQDDKGLYPMDYAFSHVIKEYLKRAMNGVSVNTSNGNYGNEENWENRDDPEVQSEFIGKTVSVPRSEDVFGIRHPTAGINTIGRVKRTTGGLLGQKSEGPTHSPFFQYHSDIDTNSTIMLLDMLIRKVTGHKGVFTLDTAESPLEVQGYALRVVEIFETVLNGTALEFGMSLHNINFDPLALQSALVKQKMSGNSSEIPKTLYSFAEKASRGFEKNNDFVEKFMEILEQEMMEKT